MKKLLARVILLPVIYFIATSAHPKTSTSQERFQKKEVNKMLDPSSLILTDNVGSNVVDITGIYWGTPGTPTPYLATPGGSSYSFPFNGFSPNPSYFLVEDGTIDLRIDYDYNDVLNTTYYIMVIDGAQNEYD